MICSIAKFSPCETHKYLCCFTIFYKILFVSSQFEILSNEHEIWFESVEF